MKRVPIWFILPTLSFYLLMKIYPMIRVVFLSFTDWNGYSFDTNFVGIDNYIKLFQDESAIASIINTFKYVFVNVPMTVILALLLAVALNMGFKGSNAFKVIVFSPQVLSVVVVAFIWKNIYSYDGILNHIVSFINSNEIHIGWLIKKDIAFIATCVVQVWKGVGFHMIILLAALQTVPKGLYESAKIDGCPRIKQFFYITVPLIVPGLSTSVMLSTIGNLKQFGLIKVLTGGGPLNATQVLSLKITQEAFDYNKNGYGAAISLVLFLIIIVVTIMLNKLFVRKEVEY